MQIQSTHAKICPYLLPFRILLHFAFRWRVCNNNFIYYFINQPPIAFFPMLKICGRLGSEFAGLAHRPIFISRNLCLHVFLTNNNAKAKSKLCPTSSSVKFFRLIKCKSSRTYYYFQKYMNERENETEFSPIFPLIWRIASHFPVSLIYFWKHLHSCL